jgi:hypothetical protein
MRGIARFERSGANITPAPERTLAIASLQCQFRPRTGTCWPGIGLEHE